MFEQGQKTMARTQKIRAVLAGCGGICGAWLNTPTVKRNVELVGFVDVRPEAAEKRAEEFGVPAAAVDTDLAATLKSVEPDVVFDCSIPEAHCDITLTALRHGCHVLGEKPMADTMPRARRMVAAAEKAGRIYAVIQNRRYQPQIRALQRFLASGRIGKVTAVHSDFFVGVHFDGFRSEMQHVLLLDMAIHSFDQARLISGADALTAYAQEWNPAGSWYKHGAAAIAVFNMTDDIVYSYNGSWCAEGCNTSWECSWRITGEKGTVLWDGADGFTCELPTGPRGLIRKTKAIKVPTSCPKRLAGGHDGVIRSFIEGVRNNTEPETICTDNIKSLAMVHAAVKSAQTGRRVNVA
jgi:predicted dehydrogenase